MTVCLLAARTMRRFPPHAKPAWEPTWPLQVAKKTALDQLVLSPVMLLAFLAAVKLMEGSPTDVVPYVQASSQPARQRGSAGQLLKWTPASAPETAARVGNGSATLDRTAGQKLRCRACACPPELAQLVSQMPPLACLPLSSLQAKFTSTLLAGYALWVPYNIAGVQVDSSRRLDLAGCAAALARLLCDPALRSQHPGMHATLIP